MVKTTLHSRSNSFPSTSHPLITCVGDHVCRLKASDTTSCRVSIIFNNLGNLKDLYERVNELIHLPSFQRVLSHKRSGSDEILDDSLKLLDVCATAREALLNTKESIQHFQSSVRRKRSETELENEVGAYMVSRKKTNKLVSRSMKSIQISEKLGSSLVVDEDSDLIAIVSVLREVQNVSFSVLKSVLCHVSGTKPMSKQSGWSLVSKLMQPKRVSFDKQVEANGHTVEKIDEALNALVIRKSGLGNVLSQLQTFECAIQQLEEGLEPVFRCLLKTQVSLLNVLSH